MVFIETSLLLELYLGQPRAADARALLGVPDEKVASWLLAIEVPVVLRRASMIGALGSDGLRDALARFDADIGGFSLRSDLDRVAGRIRVDARFARCRSLDAIHVASAVLLREETGLPILIASLDGRVRELATNLGLAVVP